MPDSWVTIRADEALIVDVGISTILLDRLPRPVTLVLRGPVHMDGPVMVGRTTLTESNADD